MLTPEQIAIRADSVRKARVNNLIEGLREDRHEAVVLDAYARGDITADEARRQIIASIRDTAAKKRSQAA